MLKRAIAVDAVAIATGSGLIYATFIANHGASDAAAPPPVLDTLASPAFFIPSIIIASCVAVVVIITAWRFTSARVATTEKPTGFRVGKKTEAGTRVSTPSGGADGDDVKDRSMSNEVSGFRVGKKTTTGT
jgi:hypothetical protein